MRTSPQSRIEALTASGLWGKQTLHGLLAMHAADIPETVAVKDQPNRSQLTGDTPRTLTWAQLETASENLACQLQTRGVVEGARVLVQLPNVAELLVSYYALSKLGAVVSPVPVQYGAHELQLLASSLGVRHMISMARLGDQRLADDARAALPATDVLVFGELLSIDTTPGAKCQVAGEDANRTLTICWTSGTTGTPKGVPRSHNMWIATGHSSVAAGDMASADILLNPFPMVNMAALGGFLFPAAILGATVVLHHPLDPGLFLQQMQAERITFTIAPPALLNQLAKSPDLWQQFDFAALRRIGSGSAPLAPSMISTFDVDYGKEIVNFYGSNEGISLFSTPEDAPEPEVRASMFRRPQPGALIQTRVADPLTGEEVSGEGGRGELLIAGATVFDGYFDHDNEGVFAADGYFRTGDLVEICGDAGDFYRIVGRCKDIINRGGMKISPAELDVALEHHPDVVEAAVCAYPDERLGEKICACLVLQPDTQSPALEQLQGFLLDKGFAKFKLPERIEVVDALPRNPLGKVQRFSLQEFVAGLAANNEEKNT